MTEPTDPAVPSGLADLPLDARRQREVETHNELHEGLTSRHLANAGREQQHVAVQFTRVLGAGAAIAAKLREG